MKVTQDGVKRQVNFVMLSFYAAIFEFLTFHIKPSISPWQVGFLYNSVVEDYFTGFTLHCKGWTSVYHDPRRPQFLGSGVTNLNDSLIQGTRWSSGLVEVGLSKFCPLIYGPRWMSVLESMCYAEVALSPLVFFPVWCFATIPQLCLLNGIPLYPNVRTKQHFHALMLLL